MDIEYLVDSYFLSALLICYPSSFWPPWFLMINQPFNLIEDLMDVMSHLSLAVFRIFFVFQQFDYGLWYI